MDLPEDKEVLPEQGLEAPEVKKRKPLTEEQLHRLRTINIGRKRPDLVQKMKGNTLRLGTTNLENVLKLKGSDQQYSEDEKASALICLAKNKWSLKAAAKECGIPICTLEAWKKGRGVTDAVRIKAGMKARKLKDKINQGLHDAFAILHESVTTMTMEEVKDNLREVLAIYQAWFEQNQLLTHEPTSISGSRGVESEEELWERLCRLASKHKAIPTDDESGGQGRILLDSQGTSSKADLGTIS